MVMKSSGFTLIELVIVIIILSILAIVAIPKFVDFSLDAKISATNGIAGSLSSANILNYTARKENSAKGVPVTNCTDLASSIQGGLPSGYTITPAAVALDSTTSCTLTGQSSTTATFVASGIN